MTQGLVTIVDDKENTLFKIVVGSNGFNARKLAEFIIKEKVIEFSELDVAAEAVGFGSKSDRVVMMTPTKVISPVDAKLDELYSKTFSDPEFNPRWECGIAEHVVIMNQNRILRSKQA